MSALPLSGIKILDLTRVLAGPLSAQMLGDLGAEVIKIERPGTGDDARAFGPPYLTDPEGKANNNNSFYLCANRNKKSVTVNIAKPEGQAIIRELAKDADVFMENYKVGDLKRYGLDYETIKAINPGIIYCSVTGFGQTGPYAPRAGYDAILQAMGGLMSVTGHMDGEPGEGPMKVGPSIVDYMTGMNTSIGILSALYHRDANGGEGQHIDVCLFDTVIASLSGAVLIELLRAEGLSPAQAIAFGSMLGVIQVSARGLDFLGGGRWDGITTGLVAGAALPVAMLLLMISEGATWAVAVFILLYGAGSGAMAVARATIPLVFYDQAEFAKAMSMIALPLNLASAISPPLLAGLLTQFGSRGALGLTLVFSCATVLILVLLGRRRPRVAAAVAA